MQTYSSWFADSFSGAPHRQKGVPLHEFFSKCIEVFLRMERIYSKRCKCSEMHVTAPQRKMSCPKCQEHLQGKTLLLDEMVLENVTLEYGGLNDCPPRILLGSRQTFYSFTKSLNRRSFYGHIPSGMQKCLWPSIKTSLYCELSWVYIVLNFSILQ